MEYFNINTGQYENENENEDNMEVYNVNSNILTMNKMVIIYNAIMSGWSVKKIGDGLFEFQKSKKNLKQENLLDDYLKELINLGNEL